MKYLLLIYEAEEIWDGKSDAEKQAVMDAHAALGERARAEGKFVAGYRLMPTESATSVRLGKGKPVVTDGPYIETREALGGLYVLDCADLDDAIGFAKMLEKAESGTIEIRPVWH